MSIRDTQVTVEALETNDNPIARVTQVVVEVLEVTNLMQVAQQFVQVISNNDPVNSLEVAQQFVQVISKNPVQTATFVGDDGDPPDGPRRGADSRRSLRAGSAWAGTESGRWGI